MEISATISSKNQVTIPKAIRKVLHLHAGETLFFEVNHTNHVEIKRSQDPTTALWEQVYRQQAQNGNLNVDWDEIHAD